MDRFVQALLHNKALLAIRKIQQFHKTVHLAYRHGNKKKENENETLTDCHVCRQYGNGNNRNRPCTNHHRGIKWQSTTDLKANQRQSKRG